MSTSAKFETRPQIAADKVDADHPGATIYEIEKPEVE
jgi:hypothetical protein